jgi:hypothetical protein
MRRKNLSLIALVALILIAGSAGSASIRKKVFEYAGGKICTSLDCMMRNARDTDFPFAVIVMNPRAYTVKNVWLRVRRGDGSGATNLSTLSADITSGNHENGIFQFHEDDAAEALGLDLGQLRNEGFQIRAKIESSGLGGGREDRCPVIDLEYEQNPGAAARGYWKWSSEGAGKGLVENGFTIAYKTDGSVNKVRCKIFDVGNKGEGPVK